MDTTKRRAAELFDMALGQPEPPYRRYCRPPVRHVDAPRPSGWPLRGIGGGR